MGLNTLDHSNPTSVLTLTILAAIATFERELMLERQREGIAKAKREGKFKGRQPIPAGKAEAVLQAIRDGATRREAGKHAGVSTASVYRVLRKTKPARGAPPAAA